MWAIGSRQLRSQGRDHDHVPLWYAFGAHDGYTLWEAPDDVSMAVVALAIGGGGAMSSLETTVLMTVEQTMDALARAQQIGYRPPGA